MFKTKFPEITPQLDIGSIKAYVKNAFYDSAEPIYGIGAESQMHRLIVEAEKMGLHNFRSLAPLSANQNIKESFESILFSVKVNNLDPTPFKDRVFVCGEGTLTNLQNILLDIYGISSFSGIVSRFKKEMLEGLAIEILSGAKTQDNEVVLQKFKPRGEAWHVHDVSTILNVLSSEWNINRKTRTEDKYIGNIDNVFDIRRIKNYVDQKVQSILENYEYLLEVILTKLEVDLPEFDKLETLNSNYIINFSNKLDEWIESKKDDLQFLNQYTNSNEIFCAQALKLGLENIELFGYKDNYKEILKNFIILFLNNESIFQLTEEQKYMIIGKLYVDCSFPIPEEEIPEYLLQYAIDNDRVIIDKEYQIIDPIRMGLNGSKKQYILNHIKHNCEKYGAKMTDVMIVLNNSPESGETYSEIVTKHKFQKQSFDILCNAIRYEQNELICKLFNATKKIGICEELLKMRDKVGSIFDYARKSKNEWLIEEILAIATQNIGLFESITDQDIFGINLYKYPDYIKVIQNYSNVKKEIIENIRNEINPAKLSYFIPNFVTDFTEIFSYKEERDALVLKIVDTYIKDKNYSLEEVSDKKESIKVDLCKIIKDKKVEIIDFLNQDGNYGVGKNTINNILSEKRFDNRTFVEKILGNSGSSNSKTI
ncbi:hypothetical protein N3Z17_02710 [Candidatus Bandiella numerosa]|uniref:hypothetical protein n=1 Tax=Candidatus Bandiella numerosa TaxID=2570586 RepID=UPI00249D91A0|nr:hypothetical protein [Candidatus Bandiella numerosa]WHA05437.1 hypothetical protein N3Z17_02710 [Candidatus Bandiella numerosa]